MRGNSYFAAPAPVSRPVGATTLLLATYYFSKKCFIGISSKFLGIIK